MKEFNQIWNYFADEKRNVQWANFITILGDLHKFIPPIILGIIVDKGIYQQNFSIVFPLAALTILITLAGSSLARAGVIRLARITEIFASNIRSDLYRVLQKQDLSFFHTRNSGELLTILESDINTVKSLFNYQIKATIADLLLGLFSFIYALTVSWQLTLFVFLVIPFVALLSNKFRKKTKELYQKSREYLAKLNNHVVNNVEGNKVVKAFSNEEYEKKEFHRRSKRLMDEQLKITRKRINYSVGVNVSFDFMSLVFLISSGYFLIKGSVSIGQVVALNTLLGTMITPFRQLPVLLDDLARFKISAKKILTLAGSKPSIQDQGTRNEPIGNGTIEFQNVSLTLNQKEILTKINLTIEPHQTVAFIGRTGSGKTTIMNLLTRFIEPTTGSILLDGQPLASYSLNYLHNTITMVTQQPFLFSETILENIRFGNPHLTETDVSQIGKLAVLDFVEQLEDGYQTVIGERGVNLSGGQKQRLSLARALAMKAPILILDDITSALDMKTENQITQNLTQTDAKTKIIVAQKIASVRHADQIFVIDNQTIVEQGTHESLLDQKGLYYEMYIIQQNNMKVGEEA